MQMNIIYIYKCYISCNLTAKRIEGTQHHQKGMSRERNVKETEFQEITQSTAVTTRRSAQAVPGSTGMSKINSMSISLAQCHCCRDIFSSLNLLTDEERCKPMGTVGPEPSFLRPYLVFCRRLIFEISSPNLGFQSA